VYFVVVILLLLVLPVASIALETALSPHAVSRLLLVGKWFVFWAAGVPLFIAGLRQVIQPRFTAEEIFDIRDSSSFVIVRELGFANLSMGTLAIASPFHNDWIVPAAIVGGLYLRPCRIGPGLPETEKREGIHGHDL
jgi:hypothetical protein